MPVPFLPALHAALNRSADLSVMVAVILMRMVEMAADEEVDVVAVRNAGMAAVSGVNVAHLVALAGVIGRALRGIVGVHVQCVFLALLAILMMQMTVVQIVDMIAVFDRGVPAVSSVGMIVLLVE